MISDAGADWAGAESQVTAMANGRKGLGTIVSVKSTSEKKRKPEAEAEEHTEGKDKKTRRGKKNKR